MVEKVFVPNCHSMWMAGTANPRWHNNPAQQTKYDTSPRMEMQRSSERAERRMKGGAHIYWYGKSEENKCNGMDIDLDAPLSANRGNALTFFWNGEPQIWGRFENRHSFKKKKERKNGGSFGVWSVIISTISSTTVYGWPEEIPLI